MCHACQTKYTVKHTLNVSCMPDQIHCETHPQCFMHARPNTLWNIPSMFHAFHADQIHCKTHPHWMAYIRETFYSANDMKELFQNIEIKNVMSLLKAIHIYRKSKRNFNKTKFLLQTVPLQEILIQNLILSTNCSKKKKLSQDDSLQIDFQQNQILSTHRFLTNKFQQNWSFRFPAFKTWFGINRPGSLICRKTKTKQNKLYFLC